MRLPHVMLAPWKVGEEALLREQYRSLTRLMPLMYGVILAVTANLAAAFYATTPVWLSVYMPSAMSIVVILRTIQWIAARKQVDSLTFDQLVRARQRMTLFGPLLSFGFTMIGLELMTHGDATQQTLVIMMIWIMAVVSGFCLHAVPRAAIAVVLSSTVPMGVGFAFNEHSIISYLVPVFTVVAGLVIYVLLETYKNFAKIVRTTQVLMVKQAELDVTLAKLTAARDQARGASQAKSDFLAAMSHELRTPMNGILGMAQSLQSADIPEQERDKVSVIMDSGGSLLALLNDVLDFSKIDAGKLDISPAPGDLKLMLQRTCSLFEPQATEKGVKLRLNHDPDMADQLVFDPMRVRQCLNNLISNALKFTIEGEVTISVTSRALTGDERIISVEVADTGIGIAPQAQANLFQAFTQADGTITRRFGGTGLGLAISRQLARLMGGDISVESVEGEGSRFTLTFRATAHRSGHDQAPVKPAAVSPGSPSSSALRGRRVLLTDDNLTNRQVARLLIAPHGCTIVEAVNGQEALDKLAAEPFDLVLLDIHMPVMDGKEAIRRIRSSAEAWRQIPVIALTADAMLGDREALMALGMTDYLSKPVDQRELIAKMHLALGLDAAPSRASPAAEEPLRAQA